MNVEYSVSSLGDTIQNGMCWSGVNKLIQKSDQKQQL